MNIDILNIDGIKSKSINISDNLTGLKVNYKLLKYVIDWQLNHGKKGWQKLNKEMRLPDQLEKYMHKREQAELGTLVEKPQYLSAEE